MLTRITVVSVALVATLAAFFWLLLTDFEPKPPTGIAVPIATVPPIANVAVVSEDSDSLAAVQTVPTVVPSVEADQTPTAAPEPSATPSTPPEPAPTLDEELLRIFAPNNRGIPESEAVTIERMSGGFLAVRWPLSDRETDNMLAEADRRIAEAIPMLNDFVLINFEGTFGLIYSDGRRAEQVVLWVTIEDGIEVHRKEDPVLRR